MSFICFSYSRIEFSQVYVNADSGLFQGREGIEQQELRNSFFLSFPHCSSHKDLSSRPIYQACSVYQTLAFVVPSAQKAPPLGDLHCPFVQISP